MNIVNGKSYDNIIDLQKQYPDVEMSKLTLVFNGKVRIEQVKSRWNSDLLKAVFPEPKWIVSSLIPEGLTILAGRPKVGKSWLILQILKAIGTGGELFGEKVKQRKCLYLALEDSPRRLQDRLKKQAWPDNFSVDFETKLPKHLDNGGISWLAGEIEKHGFEFVCIDTISRAITAKVKQSAIEDTTEVFSALQNLALDKDCPIVLIDHFKKPHKDAGDVIDDVSGSTGKTGVADTTIGIFRVRHQSQAQLKVTGRDIEEKDLTVEFQKDDCTWNMIGNTQDVIDDRAGNKLLDAIIELGDKATSKNLEEKTKWSKGYVSKLLTKLENEGFIIRGGKGEAHKVVLHNTDMRIFDDV